ncbi:ribonuclease [Sphingomonas ginkgonis]|uniref:Ribonuclease n=1 Tax=Sphingomonas ginkgonis TaxID=2315330 RepID=A0A3R9Y4A3_9SPHN|nr:ribonuclease E/G [Sphingomonas ginkgonis]RST29868.1 ribonuclease [Sphingomonas ginkgonis]
MPEWLVEHGLGEDRAVLVERGTIIEARIDLPGVVRAGTLLPARLRRCGVPALAQAGAAEYLLPRGAGVLSEGAACTIEVTRETIPGPEAWKRPLAALADAGGPTEEPPSPARTLVFPAPTDELEGLGWSDLLEEARSGIVRFPGGELRLHLTPAMTLIDVDGTLPPLSLAKEAATAAARAIRRLGIGGSIGIDFPTVTGKAERQLVAAALDDALPKPFERTAVNGFGFLQLVRPRRRASLLEHAADRSGFEARALLRRAVQGSGVLTIRAYPGIVHWLETRPDLLALLARQRGGAVQLVAAPELKIGRAELA